MTILTYFQLRIKNAGFQKIVQNKTGYDDLTVKALVERNGGIPKMLEEFAKQDQAKLIVVLKDNKQFFERIFNQSTSNKIIHDTDYPVLVYHSPDEA